MMAEEFGVVVITVVSGVRLILHPFFTRRRFAFGCVVARCSWSIPSVEDMPFVPFRPVFPRFYWRSMAGGGRLISVAGGGRLVSALWSAMADSINCWASSVSGAQSHSVTSSVYSQLSLLVLLPGALVITLVYLSMFKQAMPLCQSSAPGSPSPRLPRRFVVFPSRYVLNFDLFLPVRESVPHPLGVFSDPSDRDVRLDHETNCDVEGASWVGGA